MLTGSAASDADIAAAGVCLTEQECDSAVSLDSSSLSTATSAPSGEVPVSMKPSGESPVPMTQIDESSVTMTSLDNTPVVMTTQRTRRFLQHMKRKRMVQSFI